MAAGADLAVPDRAAVIASGRARGQADDPDQVLADGLQVVAGQQCGGAGDGGAEHDHLHRPIPPHNAVTPVSRAGGRPRFWPPHIRVSHAWRFFVPLDGRQACDDNEPYTLNPGGGTGYASSAKTDSRAASTGTRSNPAPAPLDHRKTEVGDLANPAPLGGLDPRVNDTRLHTTKIGVG
jgi:hypothetical protein